MGLPRSPPITLIMDEKHSVYLLSEGGDKTIAKGTIMGGFGGGSINVVGKDASTAIPFKPSDGDKTMVALPDAKSAQTLYVLLRGLERSYITPRWDDLDVTITSYGQAVPAQDNTQRSYTFPNAKPAEAVEYVLGQAKDKVVQDNFFRHGAHAP